MFDKMLYAKYDIDEQSIHQISDCEKYQSEMFKYIHHPHIMEYKLMDHIIFDQILLNILNSIIMSANTYQISYNIFKIINVENMILEKVLSEYKRHNKDQNELEIDK
jgi:hypothetical protein